MIMGNCLGLKKKQGMKELKDDHVINVEELSMSDTQKDIFFMRKRLKNEAMEIEYNYNNKEVIL